MNTLFDKIWDAHVVTTVEDGPTQLYIDRLYCHEVTSPQAFAGLRERGIKVLRPEKVFCMYVAMALGRKSTEINVIWSV